jgi:transposase
MPAPLSMDLRERIVAAYERGEGTQLELAERFCVGVASVKRLVRRKRETGELDWGISTGAPRKVDDEGLERLRQLVDEFPDLTRDEYAERLEPYVGVLVSPATMGRMLRRIGVTRKKRRS